MADFNDVDAAVDIAVGRVEAAVLSSNQTPSGWEYSLVLLHGEPGRLSVSKVEPAGDDATSGLLELRASLGLWGMPSLERKLESDVATRLDQLSGVDFAPLPAGWD